MKYKIGDKIVIKGQSEWGWFLLGYEETEEERFIASVDRILTIKEIRTDKYVPTEYYIVEEMYRKVPRFDNDPESELVEVYERIQEQMIKCSLEGYKKEHYIMDRFDLLQFESAEEMFARRKKEAESREKKLANIEELGYCEGFNDWCYCRDGLKWVFPRTFYQWDKDEHPHNDPNRKLFLCESCTKFCREYWKEQWNEYYSGLL